MPNQSSPEVLPQEPAMLAYVVEISVVSAELNVECLCQRTENRARKTYVSNFFIFINDLQLRD